MTKKIIGVDLGGTSVKLAILDVLGNIEAQWSIPTDISDNGKKILYLTLSVPFKNIY